MHACQTSSEVHMAVQMHAFSGCGGSEIECDVIVSHVNHTHIVCIPALHTTTISLGVSSITNRLEMGWSLVPPSLLSKPSRSDCHFSLNSAGII